MPESAASLTDSVSRSSASAPSATYSAVAGTPARRHSSTGLRPSTISVSSVLRAGRRCCCWALAARLAAGWLGRMCAGGVAPRPSSPRRRTPPDPTVGPFLVPGLRTAPRRREFPAIYLRVPVEERPLRSVGGIGDLDAGLLEPVADRVGLRPVPSRPGILAALHLRLHQDVDRCHARRTSRRAIPSARRAGRRRGCPSSPGSTSPSPGPFRGRRRPAPGCPPRGRRAPRPVRSAPKGRRRGPRRTSASTRPAPQRRPGCAPGVGSPRSPHTPWPRPAARSRRTRASSGNARCPGNSATRRAEPVAAQRESRARCPATCSSSRRPW